MSYYHGSDIICSCSNREIIFFLCTYNYKYLMGTLERITPPPPEGCTLTADQDNRCPNTHIRMVQHGELRIYPTEPGRRGNFPIANKTVDWCCSIDKDVHIPLNPAGFTREEANEELSKKESHKWDISGFGVTSATRTVYPGHDRYGCTRNTVIIPAEAWRNHAPNYFGAMI